MDLTPDERMIRDYYLSDHSKDRGLLTFETILLLVAVVFFSYGFFGKEEDGGALVFVGFVLCLVAAGRYIQVGIGSTPPMRSLIQKYEHRLNELEAQLERTEQPNQPVQRTGADARR
jgi:hypothetical protein